MIVFCFLCRYCQLQLSKAVLFRLGFTLSYKKASQNKLENLSAPTFDLSVKLPSKGNFALFCNLIALILG